MKKSKILSILIILIVIVIAFFIQPNKSIAAKTINPDNFKISEPTAADAGDALNLAKSIVGGLTTLGIVVSVIVTIILGIKYMMASVESRADYKKTMVPILIGMILVFGISTIVKVIYAIVPKE